MNDYHFNNKTYFTVLTDKYAFKRELMEQTSEIDTFQFYKKDLAIFFVIDDLNYDLEVYNNQELRYIDEFVTDYLNDEKNDIELSSSELKELMIFSEEKKIPDEMNYKIIEKFVEIYNSTTQDSLDINEIL